jgi:hypothetical protein
LTWEPREMITAAVRPSIATQKYSKVVNCSAISASSGAARISTNAPPMPPIADPTSATPITSAPCPRRVSR